MKLKLSNSFYVTLVIGALAFSPACKNKKKDSLGEKINDTASEVKKDAKEAAEEVKDEIDDATTK